MPVILKDKLSTHAISEDAGTAFLRIGAIWIGTGIGIGRTGSLRHIIKTGRIFRVKIFGLHF